MGPGEAPLARGWKVSKPVKDDDLVWVDKRQIIYYIYIFFFCCYELFYICSLDLGQRPGMGHVPVPGPQMQDDVLLYLFVFFDVF